MTRFQIAFALFVASAIFYGCWCMSLFGFSLQKFMNYYGAHGLSVFTLTLLICLISLKADPTKKWWLVGWILFAWSAALIVELMQYFDPHHRVEVLDVLAQTGGSVAAFVVVMWAAGGKVKRV